MYTGDISLLVIESQGVIEGGRPRGMGMRGKVGVKMLVGTFDKS